MSTTRVMKRPHKSKRNNHDYDENNVIPPPLEIIKYVNQRQYGRFRPYPKKETSEFISQYLPGIITERQFPLGKINKIFASQWISSKQVVFGTKCNKLQVLDTESGEIVHIPSLKSSRYSKPAHSPCGIHSIAINPSRNLLATGGENTNDLAIYSLPTFDPVCVGELGHTDWVFDISWLDDEYLVTGSRDSKLCLWQIKEEELNYRDSCSNLPDHPSIVSTKSMSCKHAEKVRALAFNRSRGEVAALSLNAYLHLIDVQTFEQVAHTKLSEVGENVCMCIGEAHNLYAVGSQSHVTFVDTRAIKNIEIIGSMQRGSGIRSVSFNENIVTIGTGGGCVYFYDIRNRSYLELSCGHTRALQMGKGWLYHDEMYQNFFMHTEYPNAIYTHAYDDSGTRLFTAGGPLPAGLWGNYAGVWQ